MALEIRIAGPGLDVVRRLEASDAEIILGRDADCGLCLPDPQRNVSRRHLSIWLEEGELQFRVLSVVNGIEMPFGEAPPGARGVLPVGQTLKLGDYSLSALALAEDPPIQAAAVTPADTSDPWAVFDHEGPRATPMPDAPRTSSASGPTAESALTAAEDDPFGEWGFETTVGPRAETGGPPRAGSMEGGDTSAFFHGLGLDPSSLGTLSQGELESMGRVMRMLTLGVLELHANAAGVKQELHADDRTMMAADDNNPLKTDWSDEAKLRYLFGGRAAAIGFTGPERALRELLVDLIAHNRASARATRATLEATLKEFEPKSLKTRLLGEGPKLFEGSRAWDAYCKHHEQEGRDMAQWTQRLLDRYFSDAYLRESLRIRRETPPRQP